MNKEKGKLMTTSEFCRVYGVSRYKAYELFNNKRIKFPCTKIGKLYYVYRDEVDDWFEINKGKEL